MTVQILIRIIAVILLGCSCYLFWAWDRSDTWVIGHDVLWPREFPYPDKPLSALEHHFHLARPSSHAIKMRGEWPQVHRAICSAALLCAGGAGLCAMPTFFKLIKRTSLDRRGFPLTRE